MRITLLPALLLAAFALSALSQPQAPGVVETKPLDPADQVKQFVLPPGFTAQLVAADPDINKPMNIAFDDQGRLWVTDTLEYPFPAKDGVKPRDTVKILEDFGPDGKARKITTFADGLNIPIGLLPLTGAKPREALVFGIPAIQRFRDRTGKGVADQREPAYRTYDSRDTHGMTNSFTVGFDGWVYACHGFANESTVKGSDGKSLVMQSGNTYRFRTDGSRLQQYTWGQVNPFGLSFDPYGNLYSADCHSQPIYQLIRGAYYPSFGKPHDGVGFAPETITDYRGSTAVCGIVYYAADAFPKHYQGSAFVGDVMTNQIVWFDLAWNGTSPKATQKVFMDSKDRWFRPVDIKLGPDGALYVADFYNCIIGHYEVPLLHPKRDRTRGRIWRIAYTGKEHKGTPAPRTDFTTASVKELAGDLAHPNLTVRMFAAEQLVHRGKEAIAPATAALSSDSAEQRIHALWVLERLTALEDAALRQAFKDKSPLVRAHCLRILSERAKLNDAERDQARAWLTDDDARVQRAAADALGQHPHPDNVPLLIAMRHRVPASDTHLIHVVRLALRNQLKLADSWKDAATWNEKDARVAADVALGVPTQEAAAFIGKHVAASDYPIARRTDFTRHAARYGAEPVVTSLLAWAKKSSAGSLSDSAALIRAYAQGTQERGAALPAAARDWGNEVAFNALASKTVEEQRLGAELAGALRLTEQEAKLVAFAGAGESNLRIAAMNALIGLDAKKHASTLGKILGDASASMAVRDQAAILLGRANQAETRKQLLDALATVPSRLQNRITVALVQSREGSRDLMQAVEQGKASPRLLTEGEVTLRLQNSGLRGIKEKLAKLTEGLPAADAKLAALIQTRRKAYTSAKPDAAKGAAVFEKQCAICHQVGGKGAKVGPQLDGIGLRGLERLLEDTLDPNRNVDAAFRQTTITTTKGQVLSGLVLREEGAVVVLADQQGKEVRIEGKDIEKREVSPLSAMPANVHELVPESDFHDLMAYLLTLTPKK